MKVLPYLEYNGSWTVPDTYVEMMWDLMVKEGTAKRVFYGGAVKDARGLIAWLKNKDNNAIIIIDEDKNPLLMGWINGAENGRCWWNFNVFKRAWGKSEELIIAAKDHWFSLQINGKPIFHVICGMTPDNNRLAINLMRRIPGCKQIGPIPNFTTNHYTGKRHGVVISYIER